MTKTETQETVIQNCSQSVVDYCSAFPISKKLTDDVTKQSNQLWPYAEPYITEDGGYGIGPYIFKDLSTMLTKAFGLLTSKPALLNSSMSDWAFGLALDYVVHCLRPKLDCWHQHGTHCYLRVLSSNPTEVYIEYAVDKFDTFATIEECVTLKDLFRHYESRELPVKKNTAPLNQERLARATSENSMFTTSYPLNNVQAKVLKSILSNIEEVDLSQLFAALLPSYFEAKAKSKARRAVISNGDIEDLTDLALIDLEEKLDFEQSCGDLSRLPTLKECFATSLSEGI
ncbi:hypothetical protein [Synechococcus sp. ROS8604]|uniref:hypothetical protein n=1 Tax=Synechococcus sp. ROS8604 TaxID=1442557 RepID=UPI001646B6E9|nr:hypothetical protein [Synechococcus sp. ROS8604]QNI88852.1 hypothetical protein SynROS8604_02222 [Synechococcus sp. ROS8604]